MSEGRKRQRVERRDLVAVPSGTAGWIVDRWGVVKWLVMVIIGSCLAVAVGSA
jgi:hypothetical protein